MLLNSQAQSFTVHKDGNAPLSPLQFSLQNHRMSAAMLRIPPRLTLTPQEPRARPESRCPNLCSMGFVRGTCTNQAHRVSPTPSCLCTSRDAHLQSSVRENLVHSILLHKEEGPKSSIRARDSNSHKNALCYQVITGIHGIAKVGLGSRARAFQVDFKFLLVFLPTKLPCVTSTPSKHSVAAMSTLGLSRGLQVRFHRPVQT